ncbi:S8 family peptidase, partial [Candidatus Hodarchaeum mangrovi]
TNKGKGVTLLLILFFMITLTNYSENFPLIGILNETISVESGLKTIPFLDSPSKDRDNSPDLIFSYNSLEDMESNFSTMYSLVNPSKALEQNLTGKNITIAIIDSGINDNNDWISNLIGKFSTTNNNSDVDDLNGHGTLVGSIIAKIAPEAKLVSIKVTDKSGIIKSEWLHDAFELAKTLNVSIIHCSIGSKNLNLFNYSLIQEIIAQNITIIVAAGNSGPYGQSIESPASFSEVISVGMVENRTFIPSISSLGPRPLGNLGPDIVAPGVNIFGYNYNNESIMGTGTSFAASFVTGGVALLAEAFPTSSPTLLKAIIQESAQFLNNISPIVQGNGLLDISAAYGLLANTNDSKPLISFSPKKISSNFLYFGHSVNGENRTYQLSVFSYLNSSLKSLNSTLISPINITTSNISQSLVKGFNSIDLAIFIPPDLKMSHYTRNITFEFEIKMNNITKNIPKNFSINIENRYPGGNILFYQGYDNDIYVPDGPTGRYTILQSVLEREFGFNVWGGMKIQKPYGPIINVNKQGLTTEDLQNTQILILSDIEHAISDVEIDVIQSWISLGRSLVIFSYPSFIYNETEILSNQSSINRLVQDYGLKIANDPDYSIDRRFKHFNTAQINNSYGIFDQDDLKFSYNGTSISIDYSKGARVLATAPDLLNENKLVPTAGFWEDSDSKGKIVLFGGISSFDDLTLYNKKNPENLKVITGLIRWLIQFQQNRYSYLLTSDPPQSKRQTQIQISFPEEDFKGKSFNGTIIEANGSYTQCTFIRKNNIYIAKWTPKAPGSAVLWINLQIQDEVPINGVLEFYVLDGSMPDFLTIFLLGGFIFIALVYYFLSTRKPIQTSPVEQRLYYEMSKKKSKPKHKGLEIMSVCPVCKTPRYKDESKYCFKCGQEL